MNHQRMMFFGMLFLVIAMLSQRFLHPGHGLSEDMLDSVKGMFFGVSIGCNLVSARLKCMNR